MAKPGVPFSQIKSMMRTYDLLLFRGSDFVSDSIAKVEQLVDGAAKVKQSANFTHVGIVIRGEDLLSPNTSKDEKDWLKADEVYVFESTMSGDLADGCPDVHGDTHLGCQLRLLSDVVSHYDKPEKARMAWCALRKPLQTTIDVKKTARAEYEKYRGLSYDLSAIDLAACAFPSIRKIRDNTVFSHLRDAVCRFLYGKERADDTTPSQGSKDDNCVSNWQFCSEMACNIYKDIGLIPETVNPANAMPADFVTDPEDPSKTLDKDGEIPPLFTQPIPYHA
jgi:hypothetical protein